MKVVRELTEKTELKPDICACISLKRMYLMLLLAQEKLLKTTIDKREIIRLLASIEHDILLLNDGSNSIDRDLFR